MTFSRRVENEDFARNATRNETRIWKQVVRKGDQFQRGRRRFGNSGNWMRKFGSEFLDGRLSEVDLLHFID